MNGRMVLFLGEIEMYIFLLGDQHSTFYCPKEFKVADEQQQRCLYVPRYLYGPPTLLHAPTKLIQKTGKLSKKHLLWLFTGMWPVDACYK